jgi:hypothetical protein
MPEALPHLGILPVILLFFETGIQKYQRVGPDPFSPRRVMTNTNATIMVAETARQ